MDYQDSHMSLNRRDFERDKEASRESMASGQEGAAGGGFSSEEERTTTQLEKERAMEAGAVEEEEPEEGEIVDDDDDAAAGGSITSDPLPQHPLEHSWTFWYDPGSKTNKAAWGTSISQIYTFSTVEEFWGVYNNIRHPSNLSTGADFHCFKVNIAPKWEDPVCANGGRWTISCARQKADTWWLHTLLAMIGEQFDHGDEICGAVVNVRPKQERISIWTKNAFNEAAQISIGTQWKEFLDYNDSIGFIVHEDQRKHDRFTKNHYAV